LSFLYAHGEYELTAGENDCYLEWIRRRAGGEPYAYITGQREFMGLDFYVTPDVLIPRPETELLVETVVKELTGIPSPRLLEIGAGSGAIAVTLAVHLHAATITACDLSPSALKVAAQNISRHNVQDRVRLLCGDLYAPVAGKKTFDAVVSNPPYIPSQEIALLDPVVRDFEPRAALDGGTDGLAFYKRLTGELHLLAHKPKLLAFEVGAGQADAVASLCRRAGYTTTRQITDLAGIPRIILAR
jgi:release factor glutamine methyltransferase